MSESIRLVRMIVKIIHVFLAHLVADVELRIQSLETIAESSHTHCATVNHCRTGRNVTLATEHIREVLCHSLSDTLMLTHTKRSQISCTSLSLSPNLSQTVQHILAQCGKAVHSISFLHQLENPQIISVAQKIT